MKTIAILALTIALAGGAAHAEIVDERPVWQMKCFPSNAWPYTVTANAPAARLDITSRSGLTRSYRIIGHQRNGPGFQVTAQGWGRSLLAVFSAQYGQMRTEQGFDHCSGDLAEVAPTPAPPVAAAPAAPATRVEGCVLHDNRTMTCPVPEPLLDPSLEEGDREVAY